MAKDLPVLAKNLVTSETLWLLLPEIWLIVAASLVYVGGAFVRHRNLWAGVSLGILAIAGALLVITSYPIIDSLHAGHDGGRGVALARSGCRGRSRISYGRAQSIADLIKTLSHALPEQEQARVFFDYWTLKEAYIKARGFGLALPLGDFAFTLNPPHAPVITFAPTLVDEPASWQFVQDWPTPVHRFALAVRRNGADLPVRMRRVVPAA